MWLYRSCEGFLHEHWPFDYLSQLKSSELQANMYLPSAQVSKLVTSLLQSSLLFFEAVFSMIIQLHLKSSNGTHILVIFK